MKQIKGLQRGMGIGGWLTNYKRFNVLPDEWRMPITQGDLEHFDTYITEWDADNIARMGMDHIRLGFDQIVLEEAPGVWRERVLERIDRLIEWCEARHMGVVLNLHKAIGNYCDIQEPVQLLDSPALQERFVALWVMLEKRCAAHPEVFFELLNEVRSVDPEQWNDLAERTLRAIRTLNPTRRVIIGSICWNSPDCLKDLHVYGDENVIYTFHTYAPFEFTHQQSVLQPGPLYYNRAMPYPTDDVERYRDYHRLVDGTQDAYPGITRIDRDYLRGTLSGAIEFAQRHPDKTLWCGEFGTIRHCALTFRENWMRDVISILKEYGIPYCVWNYLSTPNDGNRFSLVDDDRRSILSERLLRVIQGREA